MRGIAVAIAAAALPACSIPEKHLASDGPPFECIGEPLPTTGKSPVVITGTIDDPTAGTPVAGAVVQGFQVGTPTALFMTTTDSAGTFSASQGTGNVPRSLYLQVAPNGYRPTQFYPAVPVAEDIAVAIQLFSPEEIAQIARVASFTVMPGTALFVVSVIDCNGAPVGGAKVSTVPAMGEVRYFDAMLTPSPTATATDARSGSAFIANVPPGNVTVSATVSDMTLRSHSVDAVADTVIETEIQP